MAIKNFSPYKIVTEAKSNLKPNEQKVIAGRFGIGEERKTLSAIGRG
jgi:DNA-directed RNA polymerase sigma subunit (sigma70/sigma32)